MPGLNDVPDFYPADFLSWVEEHPDLVEIVAGEFQTTGVWPSPRKLSRRFAQQGQAMPIVDVLWDMPKALGFRNPNPEQVILTLFGLRLADAGWPLLDGFLQVLRLVVERYQSEASDPQLSRRDLTPIATSSGAHGAALAEVVLREAPFLGGGTGGPDEEWVRVVDDAVTRYWGITSVDEYLEHRAHEMAGNSMLGWSQLRPREQESAAQSPPVDSAESEEPTKAAETSSERDAFVSHAGEDFVVAEGLASRLQDAGWSVWLDKLELTLGDSLSDRLNGALSRSRFGVVVLSETYFAKSWARKELNAMAAKEAIYGSKVILPVWHGIDEKYLADEAPLLADRIGVSTDRGLDHVAAEIIKALERARATSADPTHVVPIIQSVSETTEATAIGVPKTAQQRETLLRTQPDFWEYLLFAGDLRAGMDKLDSKWHDHELRIGRGERSQLDAASARDYLKRIFADIAGSFSQLDRVLIRENQHRAFGAPGEPGNADRVQHLAAFIISKYEELLDTAAALRNQSVPREFREIFELAAQHVDLPVTQMREFVDHAVEQIEQLPDLVANHDPEAPPIVIDLPLTLSVDKEVQAKYAKELADIKL
jgi:hypothetical protein